MSIGSNIKKYRLEHGMSQQELAEALGTGMSTVSMWESDSRIPRMGAIQKIADLFNIKKSDLIDESEVIPAEPPLKPLYQRLLAYAEQLNADDLTQVISFAKFLGQKEKAPSEDEADS